MRAGVTDPIGSPKQPPPPIPRSICKPHVITTDDEGGTNVKRFFVFIHISLFSVLILSLCLTWQPARLIRKQQRCVKPMIWKEMNLIGETHESSIKICAPVTIYGDNYPSVHSYTCICCQHPQLRPDYP